MESFPNTLGSTGRTIAAYDYQKHAFPGPIISSHHHKRHRPMRFRLSTGWLSRPLLMVMPSPRRDQVVAECPEFVSEAVRVVQIRRLALEQEARYIRRYVARQRQDVLLFITREDAGREAIHSERLPRLGVMRVSRSLPFEA